jgi:serine protease Do
MDEISLRSGRYNVNNDVYNDVFRDDFRAANYTVVGDSDALFGDDSRDRAKYLIAGIITNIEINLWYPNIDLLGNRITYGNPDAANGAAYLQVQWQIYDTRDRKVVFKTTTAGSFQQEHESADAFNQLLEDSFSVAVNNLLANSDFHALMIDNSPPIARIPQSFNVLNVQYNEVHDDAKNLSLELVKNSVVTLRNGNSHGSGFLISSDGYIMTNAHVVGGADVMQVSFENGMIVEGTVIRKEGVRDIALVKIPLSNLNALTLNTQKQKAGSKVYAVGSPLDSEFHGTLSGGIVSTYREIDTLSYLQSDVNVNPGNSGGPLVNENGQVIAVCVSGYGKNAGINFFIPIDSALKALAINQE